VCGGILLTLLETVETVFGLLKKYCMVTKQIFMASGTVVL